MLSPHVSQQEYSPLFEQNRFGLSSATSYGHRRKLDGLRFHNTASWTT
jgi:hypothetical protein